MKLTTLFLFVHLACIVLAILPYAFDGIDAFAELATYAAVLYPLALFLERKLYSLASLLTVSTICHVLVSLCRLYPDGCPSSGIDWEPPKDTLFLFSVFHLLTFVAVSKRELEVIFPILQLTAMLSIQSDAIKTACLLLSVVLCLARTLANFNAYHSEDLVLFLVAVSVASVFEMLCLHALFTVFFALCFAASVDVKKGNRGGHFLGLLGNNKTAFMPLQREDL
jgi:hypothetical protein